MSSSDAGTPTFWATVQIPDDTDPWDASSYAPGLTQLTDRTFWLLQGTFYAGVGLNASTIGLTGVGLGGAGAFRPSVNAGVAGEGGNTAGDPGLYGYGGSAGGPGCIAYGTGAAAGGYFTGGPTAGSAGCYAQGGAGGGLGLSGQGVGAFPGAQCTGGATGSGVQGIGGATSGVGVIGTAQGGGSAGVQGTGNTTGPGGYFTGGASSGTGCFGVGAGTSGVGVVGDGAGTGAGGQFVGGSGIAIGVQGTGGGAGGEGVVGTATGTGYSGVRGVPAVAGQAAVYANGGKIVCDTNVASSSTDPGKGAIYLDNIVKAFGNLQTAGGGGAASVVGGYGISSVTRTSATQITVNLAHPMLNTGYTVVTGCCMAGGAGAAPARVSAIISSVSSFQLVLETGGDWGTNAATNITFQVLGAQ